MSRKGDLIILGKKCPYCSSGTEFVDSKEVYKESFGMVYLCRPCQAWVGVHEGTEVALGRLANADLRKWKQAAHFYFDKLWKKKQELGTKKGRARKAAYTWLASELGTPFKETHIGWFEIDMCKRVVDICKPHVKKLKL